MTAPAVQQEERPCPKCGGRTWDNRVGKKNPKAPDFKCRDRSCDGVIWPPKNGAAPRQAPAPSAKQPVSIGTTGVALVDQGYVGNDPVRQELEAGEAWVELRTKYMESLTFVLKMVVPEMVKADIGASPESVSAMTAQIFIARRDAGV
jgi:hypothetical protein